MRFQLLMAGTMEYKRRCPVVEMCPQGSIDHLSKEEEKETQRQQDSKADGSAQIYRTRLAGAHHDRGLEGISGRNAPTVSPYLMLWPVKRKDSSP